MREEDPKILETLCPKKEKGLGQDEHYLQGKEDGNELKKSEKKRTIGGQLFGCKLIFNFKNRIKIDVFPRHDSRFSGWQLLRFQGQ